MSDFINRIFQFKIGTKIFGGFLILIILFTIIASIIFVTVNKVNTIVKNSADVVNPTRDAINEWITIVHRSRMLITNWVFLAANEDDKKALRLVISNEYPDVKDRITRLTKVTGSDHSNEVQGQLIGRAFKLYDSLLVGAQENILSQLDSFEDYEDTTVKLLAGEHVDSYVIPVSDSIIRILTKVQNIQNKITQRADDTLMSATTDLKRNTLLFGLLTIVFGLFIAYLLRKNITAPINYLRDVLLKLGVGELVEDKKTKFSKDEIGEMAMATDKLVNGLKATTLFAKNIGEGKYDSEFKPLSEHDVLGNALIEMRTNLARVADEDKKRNWATEGLAIFGELLRENTSDLKKLTDTLTSKLVKYLNANQGALYLVDHSESGAATMSLISCYAWDKKKYINQKVHKGEGLVGQTWQEGDVIFLTDVPDNFIKITSGLGDSNPTCILIVPLKINDQIFGVVEIASFNVLMDYEIEFVKKIAETLASTINTVKVNAKTQVLLEESQEMTEQMRAQEEEMRQNMEELQATQEEMERGQSEAEINLRAINSTLAVCEFGVEGNVLRVNQNYLTIFGLSQNDINGMQHKALLNRIDQHYQDYGGFLSSLAQGKSWKGEMKRQGKNGEVIPLWCSFIPLVKNSGEVERIMEISINTTGR